jgi:hypothetical protein
LHLLVHIHQVAEKSVQGGLLSVSTDFSKAVHGQRQ